MLSISIFCFVILWFAEFLESLLERSWLIWVSMKLSGGRCSFVSLDALLENMLFLLSCCTFEEYSLVTVASLLFIMYCPSLRGDSVCSMFHLWSICLLPLHVLQVTTPVAEHLLHLTVPCPEQSGHVFAPLPLHDVHSLYPFELQPGQLSLL